MILRRSRWTEIAVPAVTLSEGARRLPSGETALLSALEVPFAPLWAFLLLAERPALATVVGGTVVFLSVLGVQVWQIRGR
jgi:drug/metabolite transporter (DMT)-like permease